MMLYGMPLSPFVRKTLFMLYELDLPFEQTFVLPGSDEPEFRGISPLGRIPGFVDGDIKLWDSSAIGHYLARRQHSALIACDNAQALALIVGWDKYADEDLAPAVFDPLVERVIKPVRMGESADEDTVRIAIEQKMPPVFDHLESQLHASGADWLIGDDFTYADIAIGAHMSNLVLAQIEPDRRRWPTLDAWVERLHSRPAFQQLCEDARNFRP